MTDETMARGLIWVPIIHTPEDMGRLRGLVRAQHIGRRGNVAWESHVRAVRDFWREIRRRVEMLGQAPTNLRLYQDALPICGFEEKIVRELAASGSANHRLLADLVARGAKLTGTESPALLVDEYDLSRRILEGTAIEEREIKQKALLETRDQFIAERIAQTLQTGETGLIFLGLAHSLEGRLPPDIQVERLDVTKLAK